MKDNERLVRMKTGIGLLLFLSALTVASYGYILSLDFTATDTLTLIHDSRVSGWEDVKRILSQGIMGGEFYRPVAQFSYGLDYALSGLDAAGYHLTDLCLCVSSVLLTALLAYRWSPRSSLWGAGVGGVLLALHPILLENVPAIARRHDLLAAAFGLLALITYDAAWQGVRERLTGAIALLATGLAINAKEIGVLVPVLVIADVWLVQRPRNRRTLRRAARYTLLFGGLTVGLLVWRASRGAMGPDLLSLFSHSGDFWTTTRIYFAGLLALYPWHTLSQGLAILCLAGLVALGLWAWQRRQRLILLSTVWLLASWALLLLTRRPDPRNLYLPAVGISLLGGTLALRAVQTLYQKRSRARLPAIILLGGVFVVAVRLFSISPLLVRYPGWPAASRVTSLVLAEVDQLVASLPPKSRLYLLHLPSTIPPPSSGFHERSVSIVRDHSIRSWLAMRYPEAEIHVRVCDYRQLDAYAPSPRLFAYLYGDAAVVVIATKEDEVDVAWQHVWPDACDAQLPPAETAIRRDLPPEAAPLNLQVGTSLALVGYHLPDNASRQSLTCTLYWRALEAISTPYTVFIHVYTETGELVTQQDGWPVNGTFPTDQWFAGLLVADGHRLSLPPDLPPGEYRIGVGMYDLDTLERLPVFDADGVRQPNDLILLGSITIDVGRQP